MNSCMSYIRHFSPPKNRVEIAVLLVAIFMGLAYMPMLNGVPQKTIIDQLRVDNYVIGSEGHVGTPINLITNGRFYGTPTNPYFSLNPRSPIYNLLIAFFFIVIGIHMYVIYALNAFLFGASIFLLYSIAQRFLPSAWAVVPAIFLALFWGANAYIWMTSVEIHALFHTLVFLWALMKYRELSFRLRWLVCAAINLVVLILAKAIVYYLVFLLPILVWWAMRKGIYPRRTWKHWILCITLVLGLVGVWQVRNYRILGSVELHRGGHIFLIHQRTALLSGEQQKGFLLSQLFGNYITDKFVPDFSRTPEPITSVRSVMLPWREMRQKGVSELETNTLFWAEGKKIFWQHPIRSMFVAPIWWLRLNGPVYYNTANIEDLFVGTHPEIPHFIKVSIVLTVYGLWFAVMGIALGGLARYAYTLWGTNRQNDFWWICVLVIYFNVMYPLFAFTEQRYLLPVMPFYFLGAVLLVRALWQRRRKSVAV